MPFNANAIALILIVIVVIISPREGLAGVK
jgi:hypothetical protein